MKTEVWRQQWADFPGGTGQYTGVTATGSSQIYTECWSVTKTPTGYAVACGQGVEEESMAPGDPRVAWRGAAVAVDKQGAMEWYRVDNWGPEGCPPPGGPGCVEDTGEPGRYLSSAYEWTSISPDGKSLLMVSDELMGFGFATFDLTQKE